MKQEGTYSVVVGNIGTIQRGGRGVCQGVYREMVRQSMDGYGRAAGEEVTLFKDGEPVAEYPGGDADVRAGKPGRFLTWWEREIQGKRIFAGQMAMTLMSEAAAWKALARQSPVPAHEELEQRLEETRGRLMTLMQTKPAKQYREEKL